MLISLVSPSGALSALCVLVLYIAGFTTGGLTIGQLRLASKAIGYSRIVLTDDKSESYI
jgi:hypothetical protein